MVLDIDKIFSMLDCQNDEKTQLNGIVEARKIKQISVLFMPKARKSIWKNCAIVISEKSDDELSIYLYEMFEWLRDMCWPGAEIIYNRLKQMSESITKSTYERCLAIAKNTNDIPWTESLLDYGKDKK